MTTEELYRQLFEEVRRRQQWRQTIARWYSEKGTVFFDAEQKHPKALVKYWTSVAARLKLRGNDRHLLSADIQWEDRSGSSAKTCARPFYDYLLLRAAEIEATIRTRTGMPGIVRVNEDTAISKSMMEAGFVLDQGLDLKDPGRLNEYVEWILAVAPVARDQWIIALNGYASKPR